ncbi:nuclear inhibitor of protein phosphatase 1 [Galendromus occidentalis]|uniref:Nuclear inhibitor of protein phosphatase 1 n=1 Tax=Galendromus occidentalis TaxID=34638 RepID=A0AAJ7SDJ5_9ACAR|nr:nuclear inhibitor of protein phosphatase 1 [Galendromus occidentalis]
MVSHYDPPSWAGKPPIGLHLDVTKEEKFIQKLMIDEKKCYLFGRNADICDFPVEHQSCSRVHAALVYHKHLDRAFLVDLGSTHGTYIGKVRLEAQKPTQLPLDSKFHFGASTRIYVLRERPQNKEAEEGISVELPESELELDNLTEYNTAHNRRVTMLGITDDSPASKNRKSASHGRKVVFKDEEDIINPEDIDPSVGKFRNLVQTQVIPSKRMRLSDDVFMENESRMFGSAVSSLRSQGDAGLRDNNLSSQRAAALYSSTPLMSSKLGLQLPNPAPDIYADRDAPREELSSQLNTAKNAANEMLFTGPSPSPLDISHQKKKYPKEAWGGKKAKSNPIAGLF